MITVSHDRYFLDRIVSRIFAFEGNGVVKQYEGGFTDYWEKAKNQVKAVSNESGDLAGPKKKNYKVKDKKLKFTYAEQKEYETIDMDIAELEQRIADNEKDMLTFAKDFVKLQELAEEKEKLQEQLDAKMDRWVYLTDLAEQIEAEK